MTGGSESFGRRASMKRGLRRLDVSPDAWDYAVNRLRINLTESPERRDPSLLLRQLVSDLGIQVIDLVHKFTFDPPQ